jgi:hypothetical protein
VFRNWTALVFFLNLPAWHGPALKSWSLPHCEQSLSIGMTSLLDFKVAGFKIIDQLTNLFQP